MFENVPLNNTRQPCKHCRIVLGINTIRDQRVYNNSLPGFTYPWRKMTFARLRRLRAWIKLLARGGPVLERLASAAAVSQVFGRVWLHHLVLIAASSKNWQDFQRTPSFLSSGVKHRKKKKKKNPERRSQQPGVRKH